MTKSVSLPKVQAKWTNPDGTPTREIYRWASNKDNNQQEIYATVIQLVDAVNAFNNAPGGLDQYNLAQLALKAGLADNNVFTGTNTFTDPPIVPDAVNPTDAVNLETLQSYLANLDRVAHGSSLYIHVRTCRQHLQQRFLGRRRNTDRQLQWPTGH